MRSKRFVSILTRAYGLASPDRLFRVGVFRRAFVSSYFLYKKSFEDPFLNLVQRQPELFRQGDILDIGANIGYTSAVFTDELKPGAKVYAFEPDRMSYLVLEEVIRRKNLSASIEPINMAAGSFDGCIRFWHNEKHCADHRVLTERFSGSCSDDTKISTVPVTTVDAFVRNRRLRNISFIKIDVQGYELAVCEGMKGTLERFPDACVCFEYAPDALTELGFEPREVLDFWRSRSYMLYILTRGSPKLAPDDEMLERSVNEVGYVDLLCSKRALV